ncbi:MAG: hypothetical protein RLZZ499_2686, partial [Cyanobacteriota bacterium]
MNFLSIKAWKTQTNRLKSALFTLLLVVTIFCVATPAIATGLF